jgi:predicted RND superfamily exporter protein
MMKKLAMFVFVLSLLMVAGKMAYCGNGSEMFQFSTLKVVLIVIILLLAVIAILNALKKSREKKEGIPREDEMSVKIKYKAGYQAYIASMYMWLFIFFFKEYFPNNESMLGGGILLSALIGYIVRLRIKQKLHEE